MAEKDFSFQTVAVLVCAMLESGTTLGTKHFEMMAAIDGARTVSSFEHQFRPVKARAKELRQEMCNGDAKKTRTTSQYAGENGKAKAAIKKRGRKAAAEEVNNDDDEMNGVPNDEPASKRYKIKEAEEHNLEDLLV